MAQPILLLIPLEFQKNKASTASYGTAKLFAVGFTNKPPRKTQYALICCNITSTSGYNGAFQKAL